MRPPPRPPRPAWAAWPAGRFRFEEIPAIHAAAAEKRHRQELGENDS